jgi:uncharacterized membrane protein
LIGGVLIVLPIYLATLLLLKGMQAVAGLVRPIAMLLPAWLPAEDVMALLVVLFVCFAVGLLIRTPAGKAARERIEVTVLGRLPGYSLFRSLTQRLADTTSETAWKPALAEIEDALVPAFIIEELEDDRYTIFVPSVPTPLAGAVYILSRSRVHLVDVPFTHAIRCVSRWGSGSKELIAAMKAQAAAS